jgi:Regulator of chromosome condensation (RCC1) repeat
MNLAPPRSRDLHRRGPTLILAAIIAALTMATASSAQATTNVGKAWGRNASGELGDGTTTGPETCGPFASPCSTVPVAVSKLSGVTAVAAGGTEVGGVHGLALLEGGTVMAWGANSSGQLGNGTTTNSDVPVAVSGLSGVTAVAAGDRHSLALLSGGTVMAWGGGGELGNGTNTSSDVPVPVCAVGATAPCTEESQQLKEVVAIGAGGNHSLAVLSNGTVVAWGVNSSGQLGNGTTESSDVPVAVSGLSGVTAVAGGGEFSLALLSGGTVMAWGKNKEGELGDATETSSDVPVAVKGLTGVRAISAGGNHGLALLTNGEVKSWGENFYGELGDGTSTGPELCGGVFPCAKTPVAVSGLSGVSAVAAGGRHSLALLGSGEVRAWGYNLYGQLGDGTSSGPEPCNGSPCSTKPVAVCAEGAGPTCSGTGPYLGGIKGIAAAGDSSLAFGTPTGPANLPEAGRCVKVAAGTGKYSGANCLTLATKPVAKKYEWMPASVTEKLAFSGSGLETTLTTAGHSTIKCLATNISGEWTGPKTASVNVEFQGCTTPTGAQCQTVTNPQNKSEIALKGVLGELGYIKYEEVEGKVIVAVGLDLKPQPPGNPSLAEYECTGSTETGHLEGSVIGKLTSIDKMTTESKLLYSATKSGEQRPEAFQGSPKDTLITSFTSGTEAKGSGASSLNVKEYKGSNAAPVEIKAK